MLKLLSTYPAVFHKKPPGMTCHMQLNWAFETVAVRIR